MFIATSGLVATFKFLLKILSNPSMEAKKKKKWARPNLDFKISIQIARPADLGQLDQRVGLLTHDINAKSQPCVLFIIYIYIYLQ